MSTASMFRRPFVVGILALTAGLLIGGSVVAWQSPSASAVADSTAVFPSDSPSATTSGAAGLATYDENGDGIVYQGGMHPDIVRDEPGSCPICGMQLTRTEVGAGTPEGTVRISPVTLQNIGVRTATVAVEPLARRLRATGRFEANPQRMTAIAPKVSGWVDNLYVDFEGARVRAGQPLFALYSPELVATQEEYLTALRNAERVGASDSGSRRLVEAARRRLAYWDISKAQIDALEETRTPQRALTFGAPAGGTVTRLPITEGEEISSGQTVMHITGLDLLWLMVDIYEQDLAWLDVGAEARVELPYAPGRVVEGRIDYVYDEVDPDTRTVKARLVVPNPDRSLKPGMYATVTLRGGAAAPTPVVPQEAVVGTGTREAVIRALGDGRFRPVPVTTGLTADGRTQILRGLDGGERVVTSAQFLIDSEARLQGAFGAMSTGSHDHGSHQSSTHSESGEMEKSHAGH